MLMNDINNGIERQLDQTENCNDQDLTLSIVIPTLGENVTFQSTLECIAKINFSYELIIVVPKDSEAKLTTYSYRDKPVILVSQSRGQVAQRQLGLESARGKYVLQMDDDILFEPDVIGIMIEALDRLNHRAYLAPAILHISSKDTNKAPRNGSGGFDFGGIPKRQPPYDADQTDPTRTKWLPGGFILTKYSSISIPQVYPFQGKAFDEDILNSVIREQHGIRHYILQYLAVYTEITEDINNPIFYDFRIKKYINSKNEVNFYFFLASYSIRLSIRMFRKIEKLFGIKIFI